ncbi:hypothetical protein BH10PSE14_BH10PSE14_06950 [soil metagenome]
MTTIATLALVTGAFACLAAAILIWRGVSVGAFRSPTWPPRDWRKLLAMLLLSGGGMSMTIMAWRALTITAHLSKDPWPVAYALYGLLGLIFTVFTALGWVIGKSKNDLDLPGGVKWTSSGGEDDGSAAPATATMTASMTVPAAPQPPAAQE